MNKKVVFTLRTKYESSLTKIIDFLAHFFQDFEKVVLLLEIITHAKIFMLPKLLQWI
ncbi:MAG: hypothetical protein LBR30_08225 [Clostridioides sp.]|jgi:hypothetical protein|nr:hypothetical protein [Clostridioides sp.]